MRWRNGIWAVLLLAALAVAFVGTADFVESRVFASGTRWWLAALALLGLASAIADWRDAPVPPRPWGRADVLALLTVVALAVLTRAWRVWDYPPLDAFAFEEFQTGGQAFGVLRNWHWPMEFPLTNGLPALSFALFGPSSFALRLPFLVSGVAAPALLYLVLRRVVALPAAWTAAMLLAGGRWPAAAARFADEIFFPISVMAMTGWLLIRTLQQQRALDAWAFALVSADLFYAYSGYRIYPLLLFGGVAMIGAVLWLRGRVTWRIVPLAVQIAAVWVVALSPGVVSTLYHEGDIFSEAFRRHEGHWQIDREEPVVTRIAQAATRVWEGWAVYLVRGDDIPSANIPEDAMLDPITGVLGLAAVAAALVGWRNPWRLLALAAFGLPFLALAVIPTNLNVSRYFVLLVPLYVLIAYLANDIFSTQRVARHAWTVAAGVGLLVGSINCYRLQQLIDHPAVRASFVVPENTVLAAIHALPAGARAVLLTRDGSNAFEPSDYLWYVQHASGGRPPILQDALRIDAGEQRPVHWIAQGAPEADLLPALVAIACPHATALPTATGRDPMSTVGVVAVDTPGQCADVPDLGFAATYRLDVPGEEPVMIRQTDPALMLYTIPWRYIAALESKPGAHLHVAWSALLRGQTPGPYELRIEVAEARVQLRAGDRTVEVGGSPAWESTSMQIDLAGEPVRIAVTFDAQAPSRPAIRLYWTTPDGRTGLIPPSVLAPMPGSG